MRYRFTILFSLLSYLVSGQFAPQAGLTGSTALHRDSSLFVAWGDSCLIKRGWINIMDTTLGKPTNGFDIDAKGKPDNVILSLGDAGEAIYYFSNPVINGPGFDFAIFENGFRNPADSNMAYLELATVEVSNNGEVYYAFKAESLTDTTVQVSGVGEYMDCRKVNNLAGKYVAEYGTPFDLDELTPILGLDVNNIHYIKIKDVIGSLNDDFCRRDGNYQKINDPYPTNFPTCGFDLDGIGIIHTSFPNTIADKERKNVLRIYPNPATNFIQLTGDFIPKTFSLLSLEGKLLNTGRWIESGIDISHLHSGSYFLHVTNGNENHTFRFVK
jgi:hypothetical protein